MRRWELDNAVCRLSPPGHDDQVCNLVFSPDGKTLVTSSADKTIKCWDTENGSLLQTCIGHTDRVNNVVWSSDGEGLLSWSEDGSLRRWNLQHGVVTRTKLKISENVYCFDFSPNRQTIATAEKNDNEVINLWDIDSEECLFLAGHSASVSCVAFSPDVNVLASGSSDTTIKLWDVKKCECNRTLNGHTGSVDCIAFSPDGNFLASGSPHEQVKLWDVNKGECILTRAWDVQQLLFSKDGYWLALLGFEGRVYLIKCVDMRNLELLFILDCGFETSSISLNSLGNLAISDLLGGVSVWRIDSNVQMTCLWLRGRKPKLHLVRSCFRGANGLSAANNALLKELGAQEKSPLEDYDSSSVSRDNEEKNEIGHADERGCAEAEFSGPFRKRSEVDLFSYRKRREISEMLQDPDDNNENMQKAIALSLEEAGERQAEQGSQSELSDSEGTDEDELNRAIALSMGRNV